MVQERISGNGNFDIDAIMRLANADANAPTMIDQPFIDPVADAFAADVEDMVDEIRYNPSANLIEEAQQIMNSPMAAKLGAGVMADLRGAVQLQEEKAANGADAFTRGDRMWEEREKREEKERKEQAKIADMADDAQNAQLSTTPDRHGLSEQNYADLNNELQTRAGQERFMAFLRMMNPNLSDADIRQRLEIANAITAERGGRGNAETRRIIESTSPELVEEVTGNLAQWNEMQGRSPTPDANNHANAEAGAISADTRSYDPLASTSARMGILGGNDSTAAFIDANPAVATRLSVSAQFDNQTNFAGTPSLGRSFVAANEATIPLDVRQPQLASAAPAMPAAPANAGLDV
jgi:hypothetical protein